MSAERRQKFIECLSRIVSREDEEHGRRGDCDFCVGTSTNTRGGRARAPTADEDSDDDNGGTAEAFDLEETDEVVIDEPVPPPKPISTRSKGKA